jgi:hypothetical protein
LRRRDHGEKKDYAGAYENFGIKPALFAKNPHAIVFVTNATWVGLSLVIFMILGVCQKKDRL